jgi:hypothetical protein
MVSYWLVVNLVSFGPSGDSFSGFALLYAARRQILRRKNSFRGVREISLALRMADIWRMKAAVVIHHRPIVSRQPGVGNHARQSSRKIPRQCHVQ